MLELAVTHVLEPLCSDTFALEVSGTRALELEYRALLVSDIVFCPDSVRCLVALVPALATGLVCLVRARGLRALVSGDTWPPGGLEAP